MSDSKNNTAVINGTDNVVAKDTAVPNETTTGATEQTDMFQDPFKNRRESDEWDASKVPPSRFQKRKGSIYSTPGSRDGHVDSNYAAKFHEKHAEKHGKKG